MELFAIQRYREEEPPVEPEKEEILLQKLLRKVEKRKRKLQEQKTKLEESNGKEKDENKNQSDADNNDSEDVKQEHDQSVPSTDYEAATHKEEEEEVESTFQVLHDTANSVEKPQAVQAVLPPWLSHPTIISTDVKSDSACKVKRASYLAPHIRSSLQELQIKKLFPVQAAVIPWLLQAHDRPPPFQPRDICVSAPTGSGKTLAFAIPIVQLLAKRVKRKIRALVVLPVTELANQVYHIFEKLCKNTNLKVCLLSQTNPLALEQKNLVKMYKGEYYSMVDIVVTTPGRLVDHIHSTKGFCLKDLKFLVIDEADNIMESVFQNWLYHIDGNVRATANNLVSGRVSALCYRNLREDIVKKPHKLLFSATLSQDPEKLHNLRLFHPKLFTSLALPMKELQQKLANGMPSENAAVEKENERGDFIGKFTTPAELSEKFCLTEAQLKPLTLYSLIVENQWKKFLCFTNNNISSARLAFVLSKLFGGEQRIADLSSLINPKARANVLSEFACGKIDGLISSDALARGIDIADVDIVISYDVPRHIKTYIHRIGRTARAGRPGTAITILTTPEVANFNKMLEAVGKRVTEEIHVSTMIEETRASAYKNALNELRTKAEADKHRAEINKSHSKFLATEASKDPTNMTFVERLQWQVTKATIENPEKPDPLKKPKLSLVPQKRKLKIPKNVQL